MDLRYAVGFIAALIAVAVLAIGISAGRVSVATQCEVLGKFNNGPHTYICVQGPDAK